MKRRIIKKSEILREGYVKGLKKAQSIINEMLEQQEDELDWDEDELDWGEIQSSIGSEVHDELVGRDYYDIYELRESGQLQEIIDNVESIIREEYNIPVDIDIEDDIMNHIEEQV